MKAKYTILLMFVFVILSCISCKKENNGNTAALNQVDTIIITHSIKGWELYSWPDDGSWKFSLMVGTNRMKTLEEATSSDTSALHLITVTGADKLKLVLSRFPENECIQWISQAWLQRCWGNNYGTLRLPEQYMVTDISRFCAQHRLSMIITE